MNLIQSFQNLVTSVPEVVQPLVIALAGAVPFIEGEGAVTIGIIGGVNPIVAAVAAAVGSFVCVFVVVQLSSGARSMVASRRQSTVVAAGVGPVEVEEVKPESARKVAQRAKFKRSFDRYGVPGVSLLGPLLLPPAITAPMLVAFGIEKGRVLIWQAAGIVLWVAVASVLFWATIYALS